MKLQRFIDRPILSIVISVVILVAGLIGLYALSVEQYPDIAPPTIRVSTTYSGANAEAVQKSVIVPLEEAINGVENMTYMTSAASNTGSAEITVYFKQGSDPDMAAVNVQNKVSTATSLLPAEVTKVGVTTMKRQSSMLKISRATLKVWNEQIRTIESKFKAGEETENAVTQARAAFYPNLTLTGSAGWTNSLGQAVTNPGGWILSAISSLTQPIFNRRKRISKDDEQTALLNYKQALLDAGQEVNDALYATESVQRSLDSHQQQCRELERTVQTSEALYHTGNATYLELLTARQSLLNARLNVVSDRFARCQSVINLYNALGGGCE